jgi:hypothetical protein
MASDSVQGPMAEPSEPRGAFRGSLGLLPILLGAVAGLVLCAVVYLIFSATSAPRVDPTPTAHAICADLTAQRYEHLYTLLSPDLQSQGDAAQFAASQRELDSLRGAAHTCRASVGSLGTSPVVVTLRLQRTQSVSARVTLIQTSSGWRVSAYDENV